MSLTYSQRWYRKNRTAVLAYHRLYYLKNRKEMRAAHQEYRREHKEEINAQKRGEYAKNPGKFRKEARDWRINNPQRFRAHKAESAYGISHHDFFRLVGSQKGRCRICRNPFGKSFQVDHCHRTGKVRGLLCSNCNAGLGRFRDSLKNLKRAIQYLRRFL